MFVQCKPKVWALAQKLENIGNKYTKQIVSQLQKGLEETNGIFAVSYNLSQLSIT